MENTALTYKPRISNIRHFSNTKATIIV